MEHAYTSDPLGPDAPSHVERTPGLRDLVRLFPEPASAGRGGLTVEGGLSVVGGRGTGRTTLLCRLGAALTGDRRIPVARVVLPDAPAGGGPDDFYRFLGSIAEQTRATLLSWPRLSEPGGAPLVAAITHPLEWDGGRSGTLTPRGLESWIARLGHAARRVGGVCLLIDGVDAAASTPWKAAFVAALRFTFQASAGVTPVYAVWSLFLDESLPGSNYFRNVTRPFFLSPLSVAERHRLIDVGLSELCAPARERLFSLLGGHPRLLQSSLAALCDGAPSTDRGREITVADIDKVLAGIEPIHRSLIADSLRASPGLELRLRALAHTPSPAARLPRALFASGLLDERDGTAVVVGRVASLLPTPWAESSDPGEGGLSGRWQRSSEPD